ncbi:MAG: site-specific integrase [Verrucomicrobia bacterium]|nr:site-specific integrase [Verrucomicrobiota bacterium]
MHANATQRKAKPEDTAENHRNRFIRVLDHRKQPVRGLWERNGVFYHQTRVAGEKSPRRIRLEATTLTEARAEMAETAKKRVAKELPARGLKPTFAASAEEYLEVTRKTKKAGTVHKEECNLGMWKREIGALRVDQVTRAHILSVLEKRIKAGASKRTVNLDLIMVGNVFRRCLAREEIRKLPTDGIEPHDYTRPTRRLITEDELSRLLGAAKAAGRNGAQFYDYLRLLTYTGAREQDALRLRWDAIDFKGERLTFDTQKRDTTVWLDFNPALGALLREMHARRAPDSEYLFPSPRRGGGPDRPCGSFRAALNLAKVTAKLPDIGFHDLRHHFASVAVMAGIDVMTIAAWLGHKDKGALVLSTYGHLRDKHKREAARKLSF